MIAIDRALRSTRPNDLSGGARAPAPAIQSDMPRMTRPAAMTTTIVTTTTPMKTSTRLEPDASITEGRVA